MALLIIGMAPTILLFVKVEKNETYNNFTCQDLPQSVPSETRC